jgi:glucose-6-phosphate 1-dehydrogenase
MRDEKVKVLKAIPAIEAKSLVRGQFVGYLDEKGVAKDSKVETFAALQLEIKSWRWDGVPFYIRAGKNLPETCMEVMARLRKPPATNITQLDSPQNYLRFRISPEMTIAMAVSITSLVQSEKREAVELVASRHPRPDEMEAYERVLTDALAGDATQFARQDYVEEAWRIVDPILKAATPVYPYEPHTWGPKEVEQSVVPPGGWDDPKADESEDFRIVT